VLTRSRAADYFEQVAAGVADKKLAANWVMGELTGRAEQGRPGDRRSPVSAAPLAAC
jgi:aspartyl-tRNA(Asn)/glutamyl-tRNA(Gln) amidotransferase subunit B